MGVPNDGVTGLGAAECLERRDETDTFLLRSPYLRTLSAPTLELEADRPMAVLFRLAVVGVLACGVEGPLSISLTVLSSTAVPSIPIKKWS